ncbi:thioredoxin fold domain-containing protein [Trinickia diaoshuihuensis]|uniref:thioredoxin fold domain-containing protein n=1 Tax=Trinickia diaoshuihuensis TaxID=2292265 RepID=UPI000E24EA91|nr:thioredoxin fold domain-containing protein [Trinickia diaoshuihuensis]
MRLKFERSDTRVRDIVLIETDGTVYTSFAKTGYLRAATRTRFALGPSAATGAFSISSGQTQTAEAGAHGQANHGLVFVSEVDGQEKIALIERFATEADAGRALGAIETALRRAAVAQRGLRLWRTLLCWAGAPFLLFIVSMSGVQFLNSHNAALEDLNKLAHLAQQNPSMFGLPAVSLPSTGAAAGSAGQTGTGGMTPALSPEPPLAPAVAASSAAADASVAPALSAIAAGAPGMAQIHFGLEHQPAKKTLYVYSDPNCPACRQFEAHLNDLARDFSIYVIPVAYQHGSAPIASQILCATDDKQKWIEAMNRANTTDPVAGEDCERGYAGLKANMAMFSSLGFDSTPRVVGGDGTVYPAGATAGAIRIRAAAR